MHTLYRGQEYRSLVEDSRNSWVCKPGMVSYHADGCTYPECTLAMTYVAPRENGVWQTGNFEFVATSSLTRLTLWGPGATFDYLRMTEVSETMVVPEACICQWGNQGSDVGTVRNSFPDDSAFRCVADKYSSECCECLKDERCLRNFKAGQQNVFGPTLDDLWRCAKVECVEHFPDSTGGGRLVGTTNQDCL